MQSYLILYIVLIGKKGVEVYRTVSGREVGLEAEISNGRTTKTVL
jgi:hypothetical protein